VKVMVRARTLEAILKEQDNIKNTIFGLTMIMDIKLEQYFEALKLMTGEKKYGLIQKKCLDIDFNESLRKSNLLDIISLVYDYGKSTLYDLEKEALKSALFELLDEKCKSLDDVLYYLYIQPIQLLEERCGEKNENRK